MRNKDRRHAQQKKHGAEQKAPAPYGAGAFCGTLERIRTVGLPLRRRTLYPAELQGHFNTPLSQRLFQYAALRRPCILTHAVDRVKGVTKFHPCPNCRKTLDSGVQTDIMTLTTEHLIKSGGGNGPVKPGNLLKARCQIRRGNRKMRFCESKIDTAGYARRCFFFVNK